MNAAHGARSASYGYGMAAVVMLMWGTLPVLLRMASLRYDTSTIVLVRFGVAAGFLGLWCLHRRVSLRPRDRKEWGTLVAAALLLCGNYYTYMKGVELAGAGNAGLLIQLGGTVAVAGSALLLSERLNLVQLVGYLTVVGSVLLFCRERAAVAAAVPGFGAGVIWTLVSALFWGGFAVLLKAVGSHIDRRKINMFVFVVGTLMFLPATGDLIQASSSSADILLLVFLGVNTVVAYGALAESLAVLPAANVMIVIHANPFLNFAVLAALDAFAMSPIPSEKISFAAVTYGAILLVGVICVVTGGRSAAKSVARAEEAGPQ